MSETVNKTELTKLVSEKTKKTKKESAEFIDALLDFISESLSQEKEVNITGFGKFYVAKRAARAGINPQTKEKIKIAEFKLPMFKSGKGLKEKVK